MVSGRVWTVALLAERETAGGERPGSNRSRSMHETPDGDGLWLVEVQLPVQLS